MSTPNDNGAPTWQDERFAQSYPLADQAPIVDGVPAITAPIDGMTVPQVHDIYGTNATPGATVELWSGDRDPETGTPNATTIAEADTSFAFTGDHPDKLGDVAWHVEVDGVSSNVVTVHVVAT